MRETIVVTCPYCGEQFAALVDPGDVDGDYVQDCELCCHPIRFAVREDSDGLIRVETERDDDA